MASKRAQQTWSEAAEGSRPISSYFQVIARSPPALQVSDPEDTKVAVTDDTTPPQKKRRVGPDDDDKDSRTKTTNPAAAQCPPGYRIIPTPSDYSVLFAVEKSICAQYPSQTGPTMLELRHMLESEKTRELLHVWGRLNPTHPNPFHVAVILSTWGKDHDANFRLGVNYDARFSGVLPLLGILQGPYQVVWINNDCAGVHNPGSQSHYSGMAPPIVLGTPVPGSPVLSPAVLPPPATSASGIDVAIHANDGHVPVVKLEDE